MQFDFDCFYKINNHVVSLYEISYDGTHVFINIEGDPYYLHVRLEPNHTFVIQKLNKCQSLVWSL